MIALVTIGISVGSEAILTAAQAQDSVALEPIEGLPFEPIPIESVRLDPMPLAPIEALPLDSWSVIPLEPLPLSLIHPVTPSYYHIVLVDLLDTTTDADIDALIADAKASIAAIPGVLAVDLGPKIRDDRDVHIRDYDLAVYVQFNSAAALDAYGPHPSHQAFIERQRHLWSSIRVIDFMGSPPSSAPTSLPTPPSALPTLPVRY